MPPRCVCVRRATCRAEQHDCICLLDSADRNSQECRAEQHDCICHLLNFNCIAQHHDCVCASLTFEQLPEGLCHARKHDCVCGEDPDLCRAAKKDHLET